MSYKAPLTSATNYGSMRVGSGLTVTNGVVSTTSALSTNYGFFTDNTSQFNPTANTTNLVSFNTTSLTNGISMVGSNAITCTNIGIYSLVFTLNISKTSGGTSAVNIWLKLNGINVTDSMQIVNLTNTTPATFVSGNFTLNVPAGGNIQLCWSSSDTTVRLPFISSASSPSRPTGASARITVTKIN